MLLQTIAERCWQRQILLSCMKKFTLLLALALFTLSSLARNFEYKGLVYTILDEEAHTCETRAGDWNPGNLVDGDLVIPAIVYDGESEYSVIAIGEYGFSNCHRIDFNLISVKLPETVISIGDNAFYNCYSLTSVDLPDSLIEIGENAFWFCKSLTSIKLPPLLSSIGKAAFWQCLSLTSVEIPSSVTCINEFAFAYCQELISAEIPDAVTYIGEYAFVECYKLTDVKIPSSVTYIGPSAFSDCRSITSLEIPPSVTYLNNSVFFRCNSLTSVEIPSSVTYIDEAAFFGCSGLASIEIPASVTYIGEDAFSDCNGLSAVYYSAEALIEGSERIFYQSYWGGFDIYWQATLYVRESALPQAETVTPWCRFINREAYDFDAGMKDISANVEDSVEVYTLDGVKIGTSADDLPTGIYIVRQGSEVRKIAVK